MTRSRNARRFARTLLFWALVTVVGCSSGVRRYPVSGTVKYKGNPIEFGLIYFRSAEDATGSSEIVNGRYEMTKEFGLPTGRYRVALAYPDPKVPRSTWKPGELPGDPGPPAKEMLPPKYNAKTELTAEIKPLPVNDVSFDLD